MLSTCIPPNVRLTYIQRGDGEGEVAIALISKSSLEYVAPHMRLAYETKGVSFKIGTVLLARRQKSDAQKLSLGQLVSEALGDALD